MLDLLRRAGVFVLVLERASRLGELVEDRAVRGLEPPSFGRRQALAGKGEPAEVLEHGSRSRESFLESSGERTDVALCRAHGRQRRLEE
jgi:hypothetical protein